MHGITLTKSSLGLSTGRVQYSYSGPRLLHEKVSFVRRGIFMNVDYSDIAVGSNPVFNLTLRDTENLYLPEQIYYQVQGQNESTLQWEDIGTVQKLATPVQGTTFQITLPSELTGINPGQNLSRRLIVEVYYTVRGDVVHTTQSIYFTLVSLPSLASEYVPPEPVAVVATSRYLPDIGTSKRVLVDLSVPVRQVSAASILYSSEEQELQLTPVVSVLSGNAQLLFEWEAVGDPLSLSFTVQDFSGESTELSLAL